ncbi:MAG: hypothetical protein AB7H90_11415 [Alphaproteobacteria bacterium]
MAENLSDIGGAITAVESLKRAVSAAAHPVYRLKQVFSDAGTAIQRSSTASAATYRADLQRMVAEHAISLREAISLEIDYTARRSAEERAWLANTLANDAAGLGDKASAYAELVGLSERYAAEVAEDQRRMAEAARREADRIALPYRRAFDGIGEGWRYAMTGLVDGSLSFRGAALEVAQSVERGFIRMLQTTASRAAAGPLASLLGQPTPAAGEGVSDVLGNAVGSWLFGAPQQLGAAAATTANAAALAANTAALGALTASLGASAVAGGAGALGGAASLAGGVASAGAAAGGGGLFGGLFSLLGGLLAFAGGGVVPSAAGGWALPNFPGARPALLHAREMVLPAPISEGLQQMIAEGGGAGNMHLHFHGPSDGPAVERWFTGLMARNPGVVRQMLRSNALTPRTI